MKEQARKMFEMAIRKLREANDELCRPEEDVVRALVCSNAHAAIEHYLKGYLMLHSVSPEEEASIDGMYQQCKAINRHFEEVHLSGFQCNAHKDESRFHNEPSELSRCFDIADSLDTFLRREQVLA
ncbi:HEPN domain-containing protein [Robiginitalea sediminis]|uniref:HEPN domain-containing protein n=1 Tax=Robiginitalea sediminis TaxID=1982593 RepID=UPI000B4B5D04|nr:HEPN domain-containing protein [Robiginitalea sediminis]